MNMYISNADETDLPAQEKMDELIDILWWDPDKLLKQ